MSKYWRESDSDKWWRSDASLGFKGERVTSSLKVHLGTRLHKRNNHKWWHNELIFQNFSIQQCFEKPSGQIITMAKRARFE